MISAEDLVTLCDVPRETLPQLEVYADLLAKWQKAKNLVANSTLDDMWRRHFLDSAQLYPLMKEKLGENPVMLDIGSGAGFPALVLASIGYGEAHMVEANGRKCSFMGQVARGTGANATIHNERIEKMPTFKVDAITSRACARIIQLIEWGEPFIHAGIEMWLLKGEGVDDELTEAQSSWNMHIERFDSQSDPSGVIVRLTSLSKKNA